MTKKYDSSITRERITNLRNEKGVTQGRMAKDIGLKRSDIAHYETDRTVPIDKLYKIANYFGTSADYLLGLTELKSTDITYKKIHKVTGLTDNAISVLQNYNNIYKGQVLIPVLNFLIAQEELPPDETQYENMTRRAEKQKWDEKEKEKWKNIVNEHYEKALKKWEDKNYIPIISMIEYFFNLKVKDEKIYMVDEKVRDFFGDKKIVELFPESLISNEKIVNNVYLSQIKEQIKKLKQKYKKKKGK